MPTYTTSAFISTLPTNGPDRGAQGHNTQRRSDLKWPVCRDRENLQVKHVSVFTNSLIDLENVSPNRNETKKNINFAMFPAVRYKQSQWKPVQGSLGQLASQ
jgi:hypothetical protein